MSLNPSTVSRWEDSDCTSAPEGEALALLANQFGVRQEFFLRPVFDNNRPTFLRSLSTTRIRDLDYQRVQMRWLQEISHIVEHYVDFPAVDIPNVLGNKVYLQLDDDDLDAIALDLRRHWNMGDGPCTDIIGLMERVGFIIGVIEMGTTKLDGLCSWSPIDGRPHVLLSSDKHCFSRRQMDTAHEMAHAILHRNVSTEELEKNLPLIESQAFRLASAFLMPSTAYPAEVRSPSLASLLPLKERWCVSVKAQITRLKDLDVITADYATQLYKTYSAKGWTCGEPWDDKWIPVEPRVLKEAMNVIVDEGVRSKADLLGVEFAISAGDVENLTGLPHGWFSHQPADIVRLKPANTFAGDVADQSASILQFRSNKSHTSEG
jgi:Zn-dependent peptidase ImmA (M78 family)